MSHHYSGPDLSFPRGDARIDITDLFAFPKPGDTGKTIFIMDTHPSAGANPEGPTTRDTFYPGAIHELKIDTDGDNVANIAYRVHFSNESSPKTATVRRVEGSEAAGTGHGGQVIVQDAPVSSGQEAQITDNGSYRFFAGWRSDPFFFDAGGAMNNFQFTGDDFFADKDVCSIALEVPNSELGTGRLGIWHRVLIPEDGAGWVQADRGARGSQAVFLVGSEDKDAYLGGEPVDDARFIGTFAHALEEMGGYDPEKAKEAAKGLLPDIMPYTPGQPASYPTNGRYLTDDVSDLFFTIFTNGRITEDGVGPHSDYLTEFPYVGPPHNA